MGAYSRAGGLLARKQHEGEGLFEGDLIKEGGIIKSL